MSEQFCHNFVSRRTFFFSSQISPLYFKLMRLSLSHSLTSTTFLFPQTTALGACTLVTLNHHYIIKTLLQQNTVIYAYIHCC